MLTLEFLYDLQVDDIQEEMKTADIAKQMVKDTVAAELVSVLNTLHSKYHAEMIKFLEKYNRDFP